MYQLRTICENIDLGNVISFEEENRYLIICAIVDAVNPVIIVDKLQLNLHIAVYKSSFGYGSSEDLAVFGALFLRNSI